MLRPRVLATLSLLLIGSGVLRIGMAGVALASVAEMPEVAAAVMPPPCPPVQEAEVVMAAFAERAAGLDAQEAALEARRQELAQAESDLALHLQQLEIAQQALRDTLALATTAAEDDLTRLTAVYENMKPRDAAALFASMDPAFAAGFVGRMRPEAAAAVMTGLSPDQAYAISVMLAGRNADVPKE